MPESAPSPGDFRVLELYCGIGGCATALGDAATVVAAIDISRKALAVYRLNHEHPTAARSLESTPASWLQRQEADLWWASPPCQPFTRRGLGRDLDDPRSRSFLTLVQRIEELRPSYFAMENVPGFQGSRAYDLLLTGLHRAAYGVREFELCPSAFGMPNRRLRYYLVAALQGRGLAPRQDPPRVSPRPLAEFLDDAPNDSELAITTDLHRRYLGALHLVSGTDPRTTTRCFTSAYGRSPVRSGSYLMTPDGPRRFSPREILRILGFPPDYALPEGLGTAKAWGLVGNSLAIPVVRFVLGHIAPLASTLIGRGAASQGGMPSQAPRHATFEPPPQ